MSRNIRLQMWEDTNPHMLLAQILPKIEQKGSASLKEFPEISKILFNDRIPLQLPKSCPLILMQYLRLHRHAMRGTMYQQSCRCNSKLDMAASVLISQTSAGLNQSAVLKSYSVYSPSASMQIW
jgi:hypothetical protein